MKKEQLAELIRKSQSKGLGDLELSELIEASTDEIRGDTIGRELFRRSKEISRLRYQLRDLQDFIADVDVIIHADHPELVPTPPKLPEIEEEIVEHGVQVEEASPAIMHVVPKKKNKTRKNAENDDINEK